MEQNRTTFHFITFNSIQQTSVFFISQTTYSNSEKLMILLLPAPLAPTIYCQHFLLIRIYVLDKNYVSQIYSSDRHPISVNPYYNILLRSNFLAILSIINHLIYCAKYNFFSQSLHYSTIYFMTMEFIYRIDTSFSCMISTQFRIFPFNFHKAYSLFLSILYDYQNSLQPIFYHYLR